MANSRVLIVDDEPDILELLSITLSRMGLTAIPAENITSAIEHLKHDQFQLCLTDLRMPDGDGIELVEYIQKNNPELPVAVISAHGSMEVAIEALKAGAFDFVSKPLELQKLRDLISTALKLESKQSDNKLQVVASEKLIGNSHAMHELRSTIEKLSRSQAPVYIHGESGTGKELVAKLIHQLGPRSDGPFIAVNCGAIPRELMESEFFGHVKGSFTGALNDKKGLFESAKSGTLFLDEVADLPIDMQVKLLRAIQEKSIRPVGAVEEVSVNVRLLSATHKDLQDLVDKGEFRQDLFYRINVINVKVPSLADHKEDIPELAKKILQKLCDANEEEDYQLSESALKMLMKHHFPGNVRELENTLERAIAMAESHVIHAEDLYLQNHSPVPSSPTPAQPLVQQKPSHRGSMPLEQYLESIEKECIEEALLACKWNKTAAAKKLGISFRALRYRLQKLNLD